MRAISADDKLLMILISSERARIYSCGEIIFLQMFVSTREMAAMLKGENTLNNFNEMLQQYQKRAAW